MGMVDRLLKASTVKATDTMKDSELFKPKDFAPTLLNRKKHRAHKTTAISNSNRLARSDHCTHAGLFLIDESTSQRWRGVANHFSELKRQYFRDPMEHR